MADLKEVIAYLSENKAVTLLSEVTLKFPDLTEEQLNTKEVLKALENNKIEINLMSKAKLFKNGTTQSLLELKSIIEQENNDNQLNQFIQDISNEWLTNKRYSREHK